MILKYYCTCELMIIARLADDLSTLILLAKNNPKKTLVNTEDMSNVNAIAYKAKSELTRRGVPESAYLETAEEKVSRWMEGRPCGPFCKPPDHVASVETVDISTKISPIPSPCVSISAVIARNKNDA